MTMMKLVFPILFIFLGEKLFVVGVLASLVFIFLAYPQSSLIVQPELDFLSFSLVVLTLWLLVFMLAANNKSAKKLHMVFLFKLLAIFLSLSFFSSSALMFYLFFEASLIPIFWIILSWGYQPERLLASLLMFFYTLLSSFPLLLGLILIWAGGFSMVLGDSLFLSGDLPSSWLSLSLMLAFLVKFPMFLFHLWLPKAHVEAPVSGSMMLAGVLLKLGGYGLFRLAPWFFLSSWNMVFMGVSLVGGGVLSVLCCRGSDLKVVIAYSSVVHMALIIFNLMGQESMSVSGIWWVMLAHGLVSSGMFAAANMMYEQTHSRSMVISKGVLSMSPNFSMYWFLLLMMNFAGPFSLNLAGEILLIVGAVATTCWVWVLVSFVCFFSAAYSLLLYASTQQGKGSGSTYSFLGGVGRETSILVGHIWPVVALLFSLTL